MDIISSSVSQLTFWLYFWVPVCGPRALDILGVRQPFYVLRKMLWWFPNVIKHSITLDSKVDKLQSLQTCNISHKWRILGWKSQEFGHKGGLMFWVLFAQYEVLRLAKKISKHKFQLSQYYMIFLVGKPIVGSIDNNFYLGCNKFLRYNKHSRFRKLRVQMV